MFKTFRKKSKICQLIPCRFPLLFFIMVGMKKTKLFLLLIVLMAFISPLFSAFNPEYSDYLFYNKGEFEQDFEYLTKALPDAKDDSEKAAIVWRLSRTQLTMTDYNVSPEDKATRFVEYQKSWDLALESLAIMPTANGYHWLASAMGRWGQTKGPLNSLGKAGEMQEYLFKVQNEFKADMSDSWYVLGVLYSSLPGSPISYGNDSYAISYMRRCIDTQDNINRLNLTNYLELSDQLFKRNWKDSKRAKEFDKMKDSYSSKANAEPTERMKYYEGKDGSKVKAFYSSVTQGSISDRQEAVMLLRYAKAIYEMTKEPKVHDTEVYNNIIARLNEIT